MRRARQSQTVLLLTLILSAYANPRAKAESLPYRTFKAIMSPQSAEAPRRLRLVSAFQNEDGDQLLKVIKRDAQGIQYFVLWRKRGRVVKLPVVVDTVEVLSSGKPINAVYFALSESKEEIGRILAGKKKLILQCPNGESAYQPIKPQLTESLENELQDFENSDPSRQPIQPILMVQFFHGKQGQRERITLYLEKDTRVGTFYRAFMGGQQMKEVDIKSYQKSKSNQSMMLSLANGYDIEIPTEEREFITLNSLHEGTTISAPRINPQAMNRNRLNLSPDQIMSYAHPCEKKAGSLVVQNSR